MKRRSYIHLRRKRRHIPPTDLAELVTVKRFAELESYTPMGIYYQIKNSPLVAYRINGRWYLPHPPRYR